MASACVPGLKPECLAAGNGDLVVVVDFLAFSSGQRLSQLLCTHRMDQRICEVDPVTHLSAGELSLSLSSIAAGCADALAAEGRTTARTVVVGYCSAAALAVRIAEELTSRREVVTMLVQPSWPDSQMISSELTQIRRNLGAQPQSLPSLDGDPHTTLTDIERLLCDDLHAMAPALRLNESSVVLDKLLARYRAWLGFLLASRDTLREPGPRQLNIQVLLDDDGDQRIPWFEPGSYQVVRLPFPEEEFVTNAALAEMIFAQTGQQPPGKGSQAWTT